MSQSCSQWRGEIGAYLVGALDPAGSAAVRKHLRACQGCRTEYEDLLPVRDWLTDLRLPDGSAVRRRLGGPVLRAAEPLQTRTGRRWLAAFVAAAAATLITILAAIGGGPATSAFRAADHQTGVHARARLHPTPTGTRIDLTVAGLPGDEHCRLVAVSRDGRDIAATWSAKYDGSARIVGTSAIPENQLTALRVESAGHHLLLVIRIASGSGSQR